MQALELDDIQSIVLYAHGHLPHAAYILVEFGEAEATKSWLGKMADSVTHAKQGKLETALHIALTNSGLKAINLQEEVIRTFPRPFREGMITNYKAKMLGDVEESAPEHWEWGGPNTAPVHASVLAYARNAVSLGELVEKLSKEIENTGSKVVKVLDTEPAMHINAKEHFGFRDGVGQPSMEGYKPKSNADNTLKVGEFVLGYLNEYDKYPEAPYVSPSLDKEGHLSDDPAHSGYKSIGKNSSFLVFRQLKQEVPTFWKCMKDSAADLQEKGFDGDPIKLASKVVGRWPSGAPMVNYPDKDQADKGTEDSFGYAAADKDGLKCPIGSHIRRANPRDAFTDDPEDSIKFVKKNRIIRRGRGYGPPLSPDFNTEELLEAGEDGVDRGLHFLCLNTSISRQFELIQQQWLNNPKFLGLYKEVDPLVGYRPEMAREEFMNYTIPNQPIRQKISKLPRFVTVKGGDYFFLPAVSVLRFLAAL